MPKVIFKFIYSRMRGYIKKPPINRFSMYIGGCIRTIKIFLFLINAHGTELFNSFLNHFINGQFFQFLYRLEDHLFYLV